MNDILNIEGFDSLAYEEMHKAIASMRTGLRFADAAQNGQPFARLDNGLATYVNFSGIMALEHLLLVATASADLLRDLPSSVLAPESLTKIDQVVGLLDDLLTSVETRHADIDRNEMKVSLRWLEEQELGDISVSTSPQGDKVGVENSQEPRPDQHLWELMAREVDDVLGAIESTLAVCDYDYEADFVSRVDELRASLKGLVDRFGMMGLERTVILIESCELHLISSFYNSVDGWRYLVGFGRAHLTKPLAVKVDFTLNELSLLQKQFRLVLSSNSKDTVVLEEGGESIWQEISALPDVLDVAGKDHIVEDHFGLLPASGELSPWQQRFEDVVVDMDRVEDALLILDGEDNAKQLSILRRSLVSLVPGFARLGCLRLSLLAELSAAFVSARLADKARAGVAKGLDREDFLLLGKMLLIMRFRLAAISGKTVQNLHDEVAGLEQKMAAFVYVDRDVGDVAVQRHVRVLEMALSELRQLFGADGDDEVSSRVFASVNDNVADSAESLQRLQLANCARFSADACDTTGGWRRGAERLLYGLEQEPKGDGYGLQG